MKVNKKHFIAVFMTLCLVLLCFCIEGCRKRDSQGSNESVSHEQTNANTNGDDANVNGDDTNNDNVNTQDKSETSGDSHQSSQSDNQIVHKDEDSLELKGDEATDSNIPQYDFDDQKDSENPLDKESSSDKNDASPNSGNSSDLEEGKDDTDNKWGPLY